MNFLIPGRLSAEISAVCPIDGVSIGVVGDGASVRIDFKESATPQQRAAADVVLQSFDWSDEATTAWDEARKPGKTDIRRSAQQAIADIDAYLQIVAPTPAQVTAEVARIVRRQKQIIRALVELLT